MEKTETVIIIDFGGQYKQLIARRVREASVYCQILSYTTPLEKILSFEPKALIFTGGPSSVYEEKSPQIDKKIFELGIPILGICYGGQLIAHYFGGTVTQANQREYGKIELNHNPENALFKKLPNPSTVWMSHTDFIESTPKGFEITASTKHCPVAALQNSEKKIYAVQFHPEVEHTQMGSQIIRNFLFEICNLKGDWNMSSFTHTAIEQVKSTVQDKKIICALSGGVDSSVAAVLVHQACKDNLTCIFVDHGLLRQNEAQEIEELFRDKFHLNLICVNAKQRFLSKLQGVSDPERKRKIIGEEFIRVFEEEASKLGKIDFLVQGTVYPDVIESGTDTASVIKSHHNVGGLPDDVQFKLIEPLRELFKDEVRQVGLELGLPEEVVWRQPFPGPGLAIRILGEITEEKIALVQKSDAILREEIKIAGLDREIWQYFTALPNIKSVGVMGDQRTYCHTIAIRAVTSSDGMTSQVAQIPYPVLEKISSRIVNEIEKINRVVYDITSKPPSTIEWE